MSDPVPVPGQCPQHSLVLGTRCPQGCLAAPSALHRDKPPQASRGLLLQPGAGGTSHHGKVAPGPAQPQVLLPDVLSVERVQHPQPSLTHSQIFQLFPLQESSGMLQDGLALP